MAEGENYKSLTECYQEMRNAARAEYEKGCDLPTVTLKVSTAVYNTEKVYRSATAPTTLYANMLWLGISVSPNLLKRYTDNSLPRA